MPYQSIPLTKSNLAALFQKAGGEQGLQSLLEDFYERMSKDLLIGFFFEGKDLKKIAEKQKQFLMKAMGASASYSGLAPAQAHHKLPPILEGHFDRRLVLLREVLSNHGFSSDEINTWVAFENSFRAGITKET